MSQVNENNDAIFAVIGVSSDVKEINSDEYQDINIHMIIASFNSKDSIYICLLLYRSNHG